MTGIHGITTGTRLTETPTCCGHPMQQDDTFYDCLTCWSHIETDQGLVTRISITRKAKP